LDYINERSSSRMFFYILVACYGRPDLINVFEF